MKLRKRIRKIPEAFLVVFARCFLPLLSRSAILRLSRFLGLCSYAFSGRLRDVAADNLDLAFGDSISEAEKREINKASFQSFALVLLDLFWFNRHTTKRLEKYLRIDDSFQIYFEASSSIVLTAHIGNWEIINVGCGAKGAPLTSVAMPTKNAFADEELKRLRERTGSEIAPRSGAIRRTIKALREGRSAFMLVDQNTLPEEGGVFVPFFGKAVPVTKAMGSLWARTGARIMVAWCLPGEDGIYTIYAKPPFPTPGESPSSEEVVARAITEIEDVIREHPHHWLWSYKRWRFYRETDDPKQFPFYAQSYEQYARYMRLRHELHNATEEQRAAALKAVRQEEARTPKRQKRRGKR